MLNRYKPLHVRSFVTAVRFCNGRHNFVTVAFYSHLNSWVFTPVTFVYSHFSRGVNETHAARDPDTFHNWKLELPLVDKSYRVLLLDGYPRRHSNYICKLDDSYKTIDM